jgi:hypothetical protein
VIPAHITAAGAEAVKTYKAALPYGERWAEMCALQVAPGTKGTDRAFMEGRMNNQQLDELPKRQANYMVSEATQAGISISGKYYVSGIADKRGWKDPEAWVSNNDDVLKVARRRNLHVHGAVNHNAEVTPPKRKILAESIIRDEVRKEKKNNPKADVRELREKVIEKHAYRVRNRGI